MSITFVFPEYALQLNFLFYSESFLTKSTLIYLERKNGLLFFIVFPLLPISSKRDIPPVGSSNLLLLPISSLVLLRVFDRPLSEPTKLTNPGENNSVVHVACI